MTTCGVCSKDIIGQPKVTVTQGPNTFPAHERCARQWARRYPDGGVTKGDSEDAGKELRQLFD